VELENVTVEIRPRNAWEAMDLGFSMVRQWWKPVYRVWFAVLLPLFLLCHLLFLGSPLLALLALWWIKPLLDRVLLHVYSRAVFGEEPSVRETIKALPRLLRTGLLWHLTLLRLDPSRSFRLPVMQLEGLTGKARRERFKVIGRRNRSHAQALTIICLHLETFIYVGLIVLLYLMVPEGVELDDGSFFGDDSLPIQLIQNTLAVVATSLIEPAYVAAGFGLYLNRRTQLEGWDIELRLRRMARRLDGLKTRAPTAIAASLLAASLALAPTPWTNARAAISDEPLAPQPLPAESVREVVDAVLAHEDFDTKRTLSGWLPKEVDKPDGVDFELPDWARLLGGALGKLSEVLLWAAALALIVVLVVYALRREFPSLPSRRRRAGDGLPRTLSGLDIRPQSLPDDIPGTALKLWRANKARAALSLLYRGCLSILVNRHRLELPESATEGDVLLLARGRVSEEIGAYLGRTTRLWQALAYGHRLPTDADVAGLCEGWRSLDAAP